MDKKWYDNEISLGIMTRKYLHKGETPDDLIPRVTSIFSNNLKPSAKEVLENADFLPAGRTLFGAGFKEDRKLSLSNCFVAGTQVLTTNGLKNIEHVLVGDYVITSQGVHRVNNTMSRHYVGDLYKLSSKYFLSDIICTPNHQFLTPDGWVRADRFFPSYSAHTTMKIKLIEYRFLKDYHDKRYNVMPSTESADWAPVEDVQIIENVDTHVFNLSVDDVHEYNVNGVICHNCYILPTMEDNLESIFDTAKMLARISSYGGGSGLSIDNLRPKGAPVNNSAITSTGSVSFLNIFDVTGSTIGQNGRRAAIMVGLRCDHPDIEEFLKIKQNNEKLSSMNISIKFTDDFMKAVEENLTYTLYFESPETGKIERVINAREFFIEFCKTQYDYGEPGAIFIDRVRSYQTLSGYPEYKIDISNPCLAGYTRILTDQGYFPIASLVDQEVNIWNGYQFSKVIPKITGYNQKMVRVSFSNGVAIDCTLYHKFLMEDGSRKEAKDLQIDDKLCKWKYVPIEGYKHVNRKIMYTHGFFSGDGYLGKRHAVLALYGVKKNLLEAFNYERAIEQQTVNTSGDTRLHVNLVEDGIIPYIKNWVPDASYSIDARLYWLAGLIDSDGCLNSSEGSISICSIDYQFLHDVQLLLNTLGVSTSIGVREADIKSMPANNGTGEYKDYYCQTTYRLIISASSADFLSSIGLMLHRVKLTPTPNRDAERFIRVTAIESIPDAETVYCLNEPINHSFVAEGVLVGNCSEFFGIGGNSCNLGSINLYNMINNKFTDKACINFPKLIKVTDIAVRMLDEILDYGRDMQPLELNKKVIDDWRSIGLGIFGLADAFVAMGIKYGSPKSCEIASLILRTILYQAIKTSSQLSAEKGCFEKFNVDNTLKSPIIQLFPDLHDMIATNGLRHGTFLSIAPTGTISLLAGKFTGGLEPMFKIAYSRTSHSMEDSKKTFTVYARGVEDLLKYHGCEDLTPEEAKKRFPFLVESHEVPYTDRIRLQSALQTYVDNAISSTVNLPNSATVDDIFNIYMEAWKKGVKGITIFRDGCKRGNILGIEEKIPEFDTIDPPSRREIKIIDGTTVHESTSCVKSMYVTVNKTPEGKAFEIFTNASGGCKTNINTIARLVSLALRSGVKVSRIIEELRANQCPACQVLRKQGKQISLSCSNAIADAIEAAIGKIKVAKNKKYIKETKSNDTDRECPECGKKTLKPEGKCVTCYNCGWSKCE